MSYNQLVKPGTPQWDELVMNEKRALVNRNNILQVGEIQIKWCEPSHHLAYKRVEALKWHWRKNCSLKEMDVSDLVADAKFDIINDDSSFMKIVPRILNDSEKHLITIKCMGCGKGGAPTTDNNPSAWHMKCWQKCLDTKPEAAAGYCFHLESELAPRIHKYWPKLQACEFREIYETSADIFWLQLFDLKTQNKYVKQRINDQWKYYTGIRAGFDLEKMSKDKKYFEYVIEMMHFKHEWYSRKIPYRCVTYESFVQSEQARLKEAKKI